jgi:hypothetical protein
VTLRVKVAVRVMATGVVPLNVDIGAVVIVDDAVADGRRGVENEDAAPSGFMPVFAPSRERSPACWMVKPERTLVRDSPEWKDTVTVV